MNFVLLLSRVSIRSFIATRRRVFLQTAPIDTPFAHSLLRRVADGLFVARFKRLEEI